MRRVATVTNVFGIPPRENGSTDRSDPGAQTPGGTGRADHEQVVFCQDHHSGLKAIIGIYSTALGPALGGTRFYPYATEDEALADVLRLSTAMAYKNALAGLDHGGGKAVIIGDPARIKTDPCYAPTAASSPPSAAATSPPVTWARVARTWTS